MDMFWLPPLSFPFLTGAGTSLFFHRLPLLLSLVYFWDGHRTYPWTIKFWYLLDHSDYVRNGTFLKLIQFTYLGSSFYHFFELFSPFYLYTFNVFSRVHHGHSSEEHSWTMPATLPQLQTTRGAKEFILPTLYLPLKFLFLFSMILIN